MEKKFIEFGLKLLSKLHLLLPLNQKTVWGHLVTPQLKLLNPDKEGSVFAIFFESTWKGTD